jgi:hypothetical protein
MTMQVLRYGHDSFGAAVMNGVSWDLLPIAFWAGIAVIVGHLIYRAVSGTGRKRGGQGHG